MSIAVRKPFSVGLVLLCAVVGMLAFTSAPALAAEGHVFSSSFGEACTGAPCGPTQFSDPTGVAINNATGNVYVVDKGNNRVEEFDPTGKTVIAEFGTSGELTEPEAIAIDNSGLTAPEDPSLGDVYVTDHSVVDKFTAAGKYEGQITGTCPTKGETQAAGECVPSKAAVAAFTTLKGVAVDPQGQLWVYQTNTQIDAFSDAQPNVFLSGRGSQANSVTDSAFAVNSEDDLYVGHGGEEEEAIAKLNSNGEVLEGALGGGEGKTGVAVEASSNNVYIDSANFGTPEIQEFEPDGTKIESFGGKQLEDRGGKALAVSYANVSSGDVYVVDSTEGKVDIFTPPKATAHVFSSFFSGVAGSPLSEPTGVAVNNETGDVYVVDKGNNRVVEFNSTGTTVLAEFNGAAAPSGAFSEPEEIAVDNDQSSSLYGDVYVTDNGHRVVDKFSANGTYLGQIAGTCEKAGEVPPLCGTFAGFGPLVGVAVDPNGVVWVAQKSQAESDLEINAFSDEEPNSFLSGREIQNSLSENIPTSGFAVDSEDNLYVTILRNGDIVAKLNSKREALERDAAENFGGHPEGSSRTGIAVDLSTDDVYLDYGSSIGEYTSSGLPIETFGSGRLTGGSGLAVNFSSGNASSGAVYVADTAANDVDIFDADPMAQVSVGAVSDLTPTSVTLQGSVTPEGREVSSCEFEYGTSTSYGKTAPCETNPARPLGEGTEPVPVKAKLSDLPSGTTYHYRLVASSAIGTNRGSDHVVKTPGPEISEERASGVEAEAATLQAQIDPNGVQTRYHFEYDTSPYTSGAEHGTSVPIPNAAIGSGTGSVPVSVRLTGLQPGTVYYYRAVAESEYLGAPEAFYGLDDTFKTNPGSGGGRGSESCPNEQRRAEQPFGLELPDCRAYELVSPEETGGQDATDSFIDANARAAESSANPAITYASKGSFGEPKGAATTDQFVSRRNAEKGRWETQAITPLWNPEATHAGDESSFDATVFTPELTTGIAATDASLSSSGAPENEALKLYVSDFATGSYQYVGPALEPLGASTDLSHVVFGTANGVSGWVDGRTFPVSVTNEGAAIQATVGTQISASLGNAHEVWHAVSANGSRVYFSSPPSSYSGAPVLYVRENAGVGAEQGLSIEEEQSELNKLDPKEECIESTKACTVEVDAAEEGAPGPSGGGRYWGASTEGERVFFTDENKLTQDSTAESRDPDLYEYQIEPGHLYGHLNDLTSDLTVAKAGEHAGVQGVVQISEDGSYVYFVADGVLTKELNARGERASQGSCRPATEQGSQSPQGATCNLYLSHDGETKFIATLAGSDESDWNPGEEDFTEGGPEINTAVVDPGGSRLAFLSTRELTGYDDHDANTGDPDAEIFLYEAGAGGPVCASCSPTGARPVGPSSFATKRGEEPGSAQYRPRNLLADGTLFFDSSDALVPHASDGRGNVYEYEDGHVYAISNVAGGGESFFLDASPSGEDVFFGSANKLLPQDTGDNVVVWDARKGGGFPVAPAAPSCDNGDSCKPPPSQQPSTFAPTGSATFNGLGNIPSPSPAVVKPKPKSLTRAQKLAAALKSCRKDKKKSKRQKCESQARAKYGASKKAKKAGHDGRAK
jgi:DNA-binding beta-propeller fold protein YncE